MNRLDEILVELRAAVEDGIRRALVIGRIRQIVENPHSVDVRPAVADVLAALDQVHRELDEEQAGTDEPEAGCTALAVVTIEVYSGAGRTYSLDRAEYVCPGHVRAAMARIQAEGLTPYRANSPSVQQRPCGEVFDYHAAPGGEPS